jgi:predicted NAD/FAD-dependent oxidoreductase
VLPVIVVGGGISGVACARRLHDAGLPVRVLERGHRLGGRLASRTEQINGHDHAVDIGAPYFTVREPRFAAVVAALEQAGRVRRWTDRFTVAGPYGRDSDGDSAGPERWSSTGGLRAVVETIAAGLDVPALDVPSPGVRALDVRLETEVTRVEVDPTGVAMVDGEPAAAVVLAMPDPQAARLLSADLAERLGVSGRPWSPVLAVWAAWPQRWWAAFDGIFVHDSQVLTWVADSGRSRGDGAAVLVAHTTSEFAAPYSRDSPNPADPTSAIEPVMAELRHVIGGLHGHLPPPEWERVHRWSLASAREPHPEPFGLTQLPIAVCGDGWGPRSRVEQAWLSGDGLAEGLIRRLTVSS